MATGYQIGGGIGILAAAGLTAVLLLRPAPGDGSGRPPASPEAAGPEVPAHQLKPRRTPPAPEAAPAPGSIDLLDLVDCPRDGQAGRWGFDGSALYTSSIAWGRLQVPYAPPEEYDLRLRIRREAGSNSFNLGLCSGKQQFMLVLDGNDGMTSGLDLVDGRGFSQNDTTFGGKSIKLGKVSTIVCSVRKSGVSVLVEDRRMIEWTGGLAKLGIHPQWKTPDPKAIILGSWETLYRIEELTLTPVSVK